MPNNTTTKNEPKHVVFRTVATKNRASRGTFYNIPCDKKTFKKIEKNNKNDDTFMPPPVNFTSSG